MSSSKKNSYKDLEVWQKSINLVALVYELTKVLPADEKFILIDQIKRASISIPSNLAEGQRRYSPKEMARFASISLGSTAELETQLIVCRNIYGLDVQSLLDECEAISRMLLALIKSQRMHYQPL